MTEAQQNAVPVAHDGDRPQSVEAWLALLEARGGEARMVLGLDRVRTVWERLWGARPFPHPVVTVAGTNGKGSTCAYLDAIYRAAHYRVGCYTSPHLVRYTERIRIDGREIDERALIAAFDAVEAARGAVPLTYFEFGTLAALWHFAQSPLDVVILEVGMGGRLDAVNLIDPDVAIITTVDLDHQEWLGGDREAIGREKAGIFRPHRPAVVADPAPPASVLATAHTLGAPLFCFGEEFGFEEQGTQWRWWSRTHGQRVGLPAPALRGAGQWHNASAALMTVALLSERFPVAQQAVREGLLTAELPGRFQILPGRPLVILDVAHNRQAAAALAENLAALRMPTPTTAIFGCYRDKPADEMVAQLAPHVDRWWLVPTPGVRGQSAEALEPLARAAGVRNVAIAQGVEAALERAIREAGPDDKIIVFGSFSLVGRALAWRNSVRSTNR